VSVHVRGRVAKHVQVSDSRRRSAGNMLRPRGGFYFFPHSPLITRPSRSHTRQTSSRRRSLKRMVCTRSDTQALRPRCDLSEEYVGSDIELNTMSPVHLKGGAET